MRLHLEIPCRDLIWHLPSLHTLPKSGLLWRIPLADYALLPLHQLNLNFHVAADRLLYTSFPMPVLASGCGLEWRAVDAGSCIQLLPAA